MLSRRHLIAALSALPALQALPALAADGSDASPEDLAVEGPIGDCPSAMPRRRSRSTNTPR